jgi:signal transduction histidine kinase
MDEDFLRRACAILRKIHARASFEEVAKEILECAVESSGSQYGSFVRVDWGHKKLRIVATAGQSWTEERFGLELSVGHGITGHVASTGETYKSDRVKSDPIYITVLDAVASELAVPVKIEGRVWGIINLDSDQIAHYDNTTVLRIELLAEMVASSIDFRLQTEREQKLTYSLTEAEKLSTMGHLVAGIAHEVNNPLAAILGCAQLFEGKTGNQELDESMSLIRTQAKRAGDLVRQLLAFAHMGSPDDREVVSLAEVVREAIDLVIPHLRVSGVSILSRVEDESLLGEVNRTQIQQVLVNLITNAQQALTTVGLRDGRIWVELEKVSDRVEIRVIDNGPGISTETRQKIFEPFFTTKESGKGTGLGLSISRDIALFHHGDLSCCSTPGLGSEFILNLPVFAGDLISAEEIRTIVPQPQGPGSLKPSILIIDDEAPIRWMLQRLFTNHARTLALAGSAEEAVALWQEGPFDLVISDFHLPGKDGIELYEMLGGPDLNRFVLITGNSSSPRVCHFGENSNVEVIDKPFELENLIDRSVRNLAHSSLDPGVELAS